MPEFLPKPKTKSAPEIAAVIIPTTKGTIISSGLYYGHRSRRASISLTGFSSSLHQDPGGFKTTVSITGSKYHSALPKDVTNTLWELSVDTMPPVLVMDVFMPAYSALNVPSPPFYATDITISPSSTTDVTPHWCLATLVAPTFFQFELKFYCYLQAF